MKRFPEGYVYHVPHDFSFNINEIHKGYAWFLGDHKHIAVVTSYEIQCGETRKPQPHLVYKITAKNVYIKETTNSTWPVPNHMISPLRYNRGEWVSVSKAFDEPALVRIKRQKFIEGLRRGHRDHLATLAIEEHLL